MEDRAEHFFKEGINFAELGRYAEAVASLEKAIAINPGDADLWCKKGVALGNLGKLQEAIRCYEMFIELAPPQEASRVEKVKQIINQLRGYSL